MIILLSVMEGAFKPAEAEAPATPAKEAQMEET